MYEAPGEAYFAPAATREERVCKVNGGWVFACIVFEAGHYFNAGCASRMRSLQGAL